MNSNQSTKEFCIAIAAGGTGGHTFPAEAVSDILRHKHPVVWFTDDRTLPFVAQKNCQDVEIKKLHIFSYGLCRFGKRFSRLLSATTIATVQAILALRKKKCRLVVGFGGYPSFPVLMAARILRIPIIIHEQNAVLGKVNKFFSGYATMILTAFPEILNLNIKDRRKVKQLGIPLRTNIIQNLPHQNNTEDDTSSRPIRILVVGGSQGANIFASIVPAAFNMLPLALRQQIRVWHQGKQEFQQWLENAYSRSMIEVTIAPFFKDIGALIRQSTFVISRGGASTIAEISYLQKPAIIIPYTCHDQHQLYNARALEKIGSAIIIPEGEFTPSTLVNTIKSLLVTDKLAHMQEAAKSVPQNPKGAEDIAFEIEKLLQQIRYPTS